MPEVPHPFALLSWQLAVLPNLLPMQLKPGYDGVPKLLQAFEKGLPHKVAADPSGQLVFFGFTEVGEWVGSREDAAPCCARSRRLLAMCPPVSRGQQVGLRRRRCPWPASAFRANWSLPSRASR